MKMHTHTNTHSLTMRSTGEHGYFRGYEEVECDSVVEGSRDEARIRLREVGAYSSNVRKAFCMSSNS